MKLRPINRPKKVEASSKVVKFKPYRPLPVSKPETSRGTYYVLASVLLASAIVWLSLFLTETITIGGIPASVLGQFLQDPAAITAWIERDRQTLHDRLKDLNVEENIKSYYRSEIPNEVELDWYIHQLFYDWTGYVGENYEVTPQGKLVLKKIATEKLQHEFGYTDNPLNKARFPFNNLGQQKFNNWLE